jgi:predicted Zn-dependent protease with MMP-like domain
MTTFAPTIEDIETIAAAARAALPEPFRSAVRDVVLLVRDFAEPELLEDMGIDDPFDLTGLYEGTPLTQASVTDQPTEPPVIWLFRRPILDEWCHRADVPLSALVTHVLVHEIAHHLGWTDAQIAAIDPWWE